MTRKMNPEAKAKIVAALRSGDYEQGTGALNEGGCFCVWGVIADQSGVAEWAAASQPGGPLRYDGDICFPSEAVKKWCGASASTTVTINNQTADLMSHNDSLNATFAQLADAIEEQL